MSEVATRSRRVSLDRGDNPLAYAQKLYVRFLQGLFNFNSEGCLHWEPDDERSEILIRAEAPLNMQTAGKRPAITVVMGPTQDQGIGIDQLQTMNLISEYRRHSDLTSGHLVVYCLSETDIVAQWVAHMVNSGTKANRRLLESAGGFHQIARPGISANPPSPPGALVMGDPKGLVMVQLNIPFTFQWAWSTTPTAPASERSVDMITQERRASDYPYTSPSVLERVELAMSTSPVLVRRLGTTVTLPEQVQDGIDGFQAAITSTSIDEA